MEDHMENRKILKTKTERFWHGFRIGAAFGSSVSVVVCCMFVVARDSAVFIATALFFGVAWPAKMVCSIFGENIYSAFGLWTVFCLVVMTNAILLGLIGGVCQCFLPLRRSNL